ncbi:hypothetical protein EDC96DRAFT_592645 [Choanephora cucurbitarum]|nr:hypothetical protein EDC96DRAFT_592645 [Choanephora cucurbitarum]
MIAQVYNYNQLDECVAGIQQKIVSIVKNARVNKQVKISAVFRRRALNLIKRDQKAPRQSKSLQRIIKQFTVAKDKDLQLTVDLAVIAIDFIFCGTLYNRFSALAKTEENEGFRRLPPSNVINAPDIDLGSRSKVSRHKSTAAEANKLGLIEKALSKKNRLLPIARQSIDSQELLQLLKKIQAGLETGILYQENRGLLLFS